MHTKTRREILDEYFEYEKEILETKGQEYANDKDTLQNFKSIARLLNAHVPLTQQCPECGKRIDFSITPEIVLAVYLTKHFLSLLDYSGRGETLSEDIVGRIIDLRVYAMLLDCLIRDK